MSTSQLLEKILDQPDAPQLAEQLQNVLQEEKKRRVAFYNEITEQQKAEFINGEVVIHSPMKRPHNEISINLVKLLDTFVVKHDLGFVGIEKIMISLTRNDYEPDICFFRKEISETFEPEQVLFPAPDFIIEILSKKTAQKDGGVKFQDYQQHSIKEYWIVDAKKKTVEQYLLQKGKYELIFKANKGDIESVVLQGFIIPMEAIFDKKANMMALVKLLT